MNVAACAKKQAQCSWLVPLNNITVGAFVLFQSFCPFVNLPYYIYYITKYIYIYNYIAIYVYIYRSIFIHLTHTSIDHVIIEFVFATGHVVNIA